MKKQEIKKIIEEIKNNKILNINEHIYFSNLDDQMFLNLHFFTELMNIENINKDILDCLLKNIFTNISLLKIEKNYKLLHIMNSKIFKELIVNLLNDEIIKNRFLIIYLCHESKLSNLLKEIVEDKYLKEEIDLYKDKKIKNIVYEEFKELMFTKKIEDTKFIDEHYKIIYELIETNMSQERLISISKKLNAVIHELKLSFKIVGYKKEQVAKIYNNLKPLISNKCVTEFANMLYHSNLKTEFFELISNKKIVLIELLYIAKFSNEELNIILEIYKDKRYKGSAYNLYAFFKLKEMLYGLMKNNIIDLESKDFISKPAIKESLQMIQQLESF